MSEFELTKANYIDKHNASLVAGLTHDDFRRQKIAWVASIIENENPKSLLDFGFGTGELLEDLLAIGRGLALSGVEPSESLRTELVARHKTATFSHIASTLDEIPEGSIDLMTCFNVLHHIAPSERARLSEQMILKLAPRGLLLVWEHNPYNPATQFIVGRCEYDDDAVLLSRSETQKLFVNLEIETSDYVNVTPPKLQQRPFFRWLETAMKRIPTGAQYRIAFRKSA